MTSLAFFQTWFHQHLEQIREDYFQFLRFRSISSEPAFKNDMRRCAEWVAKYLQDSKLHSELIETTGYPIVYAESHHLANKPTVLIYGHYDVQPVDPLELWKSDPFEATERDGKIFARGAVDDKGQIFFAMAAIRAYLDAGNGLPINLKFCIEGEEESGSKGLSEALARIKQKLRADYLMVVDHDAYDAVTPAINLGARGMLSMEVTLQGSRDDLHSGVYGGIAYNPNRALVELLAKLYTKDGLVAVDGFYDDVVETAQEEKNAYQERYTKADYQELFGIEAFASEKGRSLHEANLFRPVLEINGIGGGYFGVGFKTVIPAKAVAKISCRLVPNQNPQKIGQAIVAFLKKHCEPGMRLSVDMHTGSEAYRANPHSKIAAAVAKAAEEVTGKLCRRVLSGASIPIIEALSSAIGADIVGMGYGLPSDQIHAPNEHFDMNRLKYGFLTIARAIDLL